MRALVVANLMLAVMLSTGAGGASRSEGQGGAFLKHAGSDQRSGELIVILGASYARGLKDIPVDGVTFANRGVAGEQSFEMLARFDRDVLELRPRRVIVWGFINDIFRSKREDIAPTLERTRNSLKEMVDIAQANGIVPILATEVTIRERSGLKETLMAWLGRILGKESYQDYVNRNVLATNYWVRELARSKGIELLDYESLLADPRGKRIKAYAADDGSHISSAGYERLSRYTAERLVRGAIPR